MATINIATQEHKPTILDSITILIMKIFKREDKEITHNSPLIQTNNGKKLKDACQEYESRNIEITQATSRVYFRSILT
jgi:hypothetical protein